MPELESYLLELSKQLHSSLDENDDVKKRFESDGEDSKEGEAGEDDEEVKEGEESRSRK